MTPRHTHLAVVIPSTPTGRPLASLQVNRFSFLIQATPPALVVPSVARNISWRIDWRYRGATVGRELSLCKGMMEVELHY
jgi:hypothetical protein